MKLNFKSAKNRIIVDHYKNRPLGPQSILTGISVISEILPHSQVKEALIPILVSLGYIKEEILDQNDGADEESGVLILSGPILEFDGVDSLLNFLENSESVLRILKELDRALPSMFKIVVPMEG